MRPPPPPPGPPAVLVYDGDCALCEGLSAWLVRRGWLAESQRRPFQAFEGARAGRLLEAGIRNSLLVVEPGTGRVRAGVGGLLGLLRPTPAGRWAAWLDRRPLRWALGVLYRVVARNRRLLAPVPPDRPPCACDPDPDPLALALLLGACATLAAGGAAALGWAASGFGSHGPAPRGALLGLAALALGLLPITGAALLGGGRERLARAGHVVVESAVLGLWLLGGALLLAAVGRLGVAAGPLGALVWFALGLALVGRTAAWRARRLGLPAAAAWLLVASLGAGALVALLAWPRP